MLALCHFVGVHNVIYEWAKFSKRCQDTGECAEHIITFVHKLAKHCKYGSLCDDTSLSVRLQQNPKWEISTVVVQVRQHKEVEKQPAVMHTIQADIFLGILEVMDPFDITRVWDSISLFMVWLGQDRKESQWEEAG